MEHSNDSRKRTTMVEMLSTAAEQVEVALSGYLSPERLVGTPERLGKAMRHAVLGGGKRFRPFLVLETARLFGVSQADAMPAAVAVELIHCYSLVHDDLPSMDNDTLRRGQPTVWTAFDEWTAILAGDALLTMAFEIASSPAAIAAPDCRADVVQALARAAGSAGMVGGQVMDLEAGKLGLPPAPDAAHIGDLQALKTGRLISVTCEIGASLGRAEPTQRDALIRYGQNLGFAFQISDDLLDAEGCAETVGKATGKDARDGKATLVSLLGVSEARARLDRATDDAIAALQMFAGDADRLRQAAAFMQRRKS